MTIDLFILLASDITNLFIGLAVLLRNPKLAINRIFAMLSFALVFWTSANFLADNVSTEWTLFFCRLTFVGGVFIALSTGTLSRYLPNSDILQHSKFNKVQPFLGGAAIVLSFAPGMIGSASRGDAGANLQLGPLYFLYIVYILQALTLLVFNFTYQFRHARAGYQRDQLRLVALGLSLYAGFAVIFNLILPVIIQNWVSSKYGPLFSLFFVGLAASAIVRHRLFDVRLAIARSIAYLGSLITFATLYGFMIFALTRFVFGFEIPVLAQVAISAVTGIAALSFNFFRRIFDRVTNRLFYKDAYDPQEFFDIFNKNLVSSIDLLNLLDSTSHTIADFLRTRYTITAVRGSNRHFIYSGTLRKNSTDQKIKALSHIVLSYKQKQAVIVTDELTTEHEKLRDILMEHEIAVLVRLDMAYPKELQKGVGFIALGQKINGGSYNNLDIRVLETVANELVIAVQNALRFEEIRDFNETLQNKVDEATAKLRRSNAKLKQLDEAKDEFISMASHQLRTPLTTIKGYLSMVLEGDAGDLQSGQKRLLEEAYSGAQRMVYLIADFLNVSRLKTGKFMLEYSTVNLTHLIGEEIGQLRVTAKSRQLKLQYEAPETFPAARLDENKIRQVVMNLIDNAIYYSKPGGTIKVELLSDDGHVSFKVKDTGIGVPANEQKDLFEKFYRASNARKVRPDGTGIGLFMIKKVILAHGGSIIFHSTEGQGSTFGFSLPLKAKPQTKELKAESLQRSGK